MNIQDNFLPLVSVDFLLSVDPAEMISFRVKKVWGLDY